MADNGNNELTEKKVAEVVEISITTDDIHVAVDETPNPPTVPTVVASTASSSSQSVLTGQTTLAVRMWNCAKWTGLKIFNTMDAIGEVVCHVLGLDDSRYQYVIDGMDENDWQIAREVQAKKDRAAQNGQNAA